MSRPWVPEGASTSSQGGLGALVEGELSVTPGETLYVEVGGNGGLGTGGFNGGGGAQAGGGGGGGASDLRTSPLSAGLSPDDRLIVAGGGGGSGAHGEEGGGAGGAAGSAGESIAPNEGGGAGTSEAGGTAGQGHCSVANPGQLGTGGTGGDYKYGGGGGGAGYFGGGGGGGGCFAGGAGGGGGSSLLPAGATLSTAPQATEPQIQITYNKPPNPTVVTGAASEVAQTSATLTASVNPEGFEVTSCDFQYGTSLSYGSSVPCASLPGSGTSPALVSAAAAPLTADTTYYFRVVATNIEGTSYGSPVQLTTPPNPPATVTRPATVVGRTSAQLNATVDPEGGLLGSCYFEYGTTTGYGSTAPCSPLPGAGTTAVSTSAEVTLSANTNYHFRVVAENPSGTRYGTDETFATRAQTATFGFTDGEQEFTVPTGVFSIDVSAVGARGASTSSQGGLGALVEGELSVTPGETLYVEVGGNGGLGTGGFNGGGGAQAGGGGGGGASDLRTSPLSAGLSPDDRLIVAGGGGGSGAHGEEGGGAGGAAGSAGESIAPNEGGGAGTSEAGGTAGQGHCSVANPGRLGTGGTGGDYKYGGGGGGAGYFGGGGGGGGCFAGGAGGGGGSSLLPAGATLSTAPQATEPQIQITYTAPTVTSVKPDAGLQGGGTSVRFKGTYLATVSAVKFGATSVPAACTESECVATAPPGTGAVHLTVTTTGATSAPEPGNLFTYVPPGAAPAVKRLSVKKGPAAGGTAVTITGSGFTGVSEVSFGGTTATQVTVLSSTSMTVLSPPSASGNDEVTVTTPNGTSPPTNKDRFKYLAPTITAVDPGSGSKLGDTLVTVKGTGFAQGTTGTTFQFAKAQATSVSCSSTTSCTMLAPAAKRAGAVDVKATVAGMKSHKSSPADLFTYGP